MFVCFACLAQDGCPVQLLDSVCKYFKWPKALVSLQANGTEISMISSFWVSGFCDLAIDLTNLDTHQSQGISKDTTIVARVLEIPH